MSGVGKDSLNIGAGGYTLTGKDAVNVNPKGRSLTGNDQINIGPGAYDGYTTSGLDAIMQAHADKLHPLSK